MDIYYVVYSVVLAGCTTPLVLSGRWRRVLLIFTCSVLFLFLLGLAAIRSPNVDHDYADYLGWFSTIRAGSLGLVDFAKDPGFVVVSILVSALGGSYMWVAGIFAAIALGMKLAVGRFAAGVAMLPLFLYLELCRFFLVQDMTAIRAAVAIPIMTLAVLMILRGRRKSGAIVFLVALLFHASALLGIPVLLVAWFGGIESRKPFIVLCVCAAGCLLFLKSLLLYLSDMARVADYLSGNNEGAGISLLSVYFVVRVSLMVIIIVRWWGRVSPEDRFVVFCSGVGIAVQIVLSSNGALALRGAEVFGIFDILMFLIPLRLLRKEAQLAYLLVIIVLGGVFYRSSTKAINPYRMAVAYSADLNVQSHPSSSIDGNTTRDCFL